MLTWGRSECGIRGVASVDHVTAPQCHSNRSYKTCSMPNNFIRRPKSSHELSSIFSPNFVRKQFTDETTWMRTKATEGGGGRSLLEPDGRGGPHVLLRFDNNSIYNRLRCSILVKCWLMSVASVEVCWSMVEAEKGDSRGWIVAVAENLVMGQSCHGGDG
ncbi:hypothetical protein NC652_039515 [Populus alba x Populus x berolinensis]|nr:hypothetical protein NC652_039515 [Populus alba x Populus x berolinensis]